MAEVLIVEDDESLRATVADLLCEIGYRPITAGNGAEAVEIASHTDLMAILMDIDMPVMNGLDATRAIRSLPDRQGRVPIFAYSGRTSRTDVGRCLDVGMNGCLPKGNVRAIVECLAGIGLPEHSPFDPGVRYAMVVDDMPILLSAMKTFLENQGFVVLTARDGVEAVEIAPTFPLSLIITDLQMPRMDGLTAARKIRALGGRLDQVPIIACSASCVSPEALHAAGIDEFVAKGADRDVLLACIGRLVGPECQNT